MNTFDFMVPSKIVFGAGRFNNAGYLLKEYGQKGMIVCDSWCAEIGQAAKLERSMNDAGMTAVIYDGVIPNPTVDVVDKGADIAKQESCDFVIGLGGGSSMDTAKGIAVAAPHEGSIWPYAIGERDISSKTLPVIAITTTSGTGSQCTCFAVISNPETKQKPGMGSPHILPRLALVDPELMLSVPSQLTANTGFDVFSHAVEAYTSKVSSPMSDMYAEKALQLVGQHLIQCYRKGDDLNARYGMALADTCAGIAICNAVVTLPHVLAHVISGHFEDIPHGDALFSIYRETLRFNCQALPEKHKFIANAIDPGNDDIVSAFDKFFANFGFENKLKQKYAEQPEIINYIAEDTFTYMKGITELNPVPATIDDARNILETSLAEGDSRIS